MRRIRDLLDDEGGQAMLEYGLLAGALALGLIVAVKAMGLAFGLGFDRHAKGLSRSR